MGLFGHHLSLYVSSPNQLLEKIRLTAVIAVYLAGIGHHESELNPANAVVLYKVITW